MLLLYQALGKARISLSRRISYLKEADPISQTAEKEKAYTHNCKLSVVTGFGNQI